MKRMSITLPKQTFEMLDALQSIYDTESRSKTITEIIKRFLVSPNYNELEKIRFPNSTKKEKSTFSMDSYAEKKLSEIKEKSNKKSINKTLYSIIEIVYDKEISIIKNKMNGLKKLNHI